MARIDILLPVKNGIEFFAESIDSILIQSITDWRLLILDHGSTDGSLELAQAYANKDSRIKLHAFPQASGLSGLLNCGLAICDAEFIMRHDADDICYPNRMELVLQAFVDDPDCVVIGGQADIIDDSGKKTGELKVPVNRKHIAAAALFYNPMIHPSTMMRHSAIRAMGVKYGNDFLLAIPESERMEVPECAEDYFLFGQLAILGKCKNVPHKLIRYRWHAKNVSYTRFGEQIKVSLSIARYLARSFSLLHRVDKFDPAPFCGLGGRLTDLGQHKELALAAAFERMAKILQKGFSASHDLHRELSFRRVTATRNTWRMVWRYCQFRTQYRPVSNEWSLVRNWLVGRLPFKRSSVTVSPVSVEEMSKNKLN